MAELLKQQHHLVVLRLSLDRSTASSSSPGCTLFILEVAGQKLIEIPVDCAIIGVPNSLREARKYLYSDPPYSIPEDVVKQLKAKLSEVLEPDMPLWLQFTNDCGILPVVPWEWLLQSRLGVPLLRLPYFAINPFSATSSSLDIVLCASTAETKEAIPVEALLDKLTRRILEAVQHDNVTIHVFANARFYPNLQYILQDRMTPIERVKLYNAEDTLTSSFSSTSISSAGGIRDTTGLENPWLLWIMNTLHGRSVDVLHFVCHAYLSADQGTLAFEESPKSAEEHRWAQFVEPQQLGTFATQLGAWSICFSSPILNFSPAGMRLLADQFARLQPGPVLLHEVKEDTECYALAKAYRFLYDEVENLPPPSPALALYCHPSHVKQIEQLPNAIDQARMLHQYTLAKGETLKILESKENTPTWVASSQRYLEQSLAEMLKGDASSSAFVPSSTQQGVEEALSFLSDVLERHASSGSDVKEDPR